MCESGLKLEIADLLVSRVTLRTPAATADEWNRDPVTHVPMSNRLAHSHYDAGQFMAGNVRQYNVRVVPLPAMPVTQANAARHDFQHYGIAPWCRVLYVLNLRRLTKRPVNDSFHSVFSSPAILRSSYIGDGCCREMFIALKFRILASHEHTDRLAA
jgi:hypothetical protein